MDINTESTWGALVKKVWLKSRTHLLTGLIGAALMGGGWIWNLAEASQWLKDQVKANTDDIVIIKGDVKVIREDFSKHKEDQREKEGETKALSDKVTNLSAKLDDTQTQMHHLEILLVQEAKSRSFNHAN